MYLNTQYCLLDDSVRKEYKPFRVSNLLLIPLNLTKYRSVILATTLSSSCTLGTHLIQ